MIPLFFPITIFVHPIRFIAWLSLDQRRIEARRDGFVPCVVRGNFVAPAFSHAEWGKACMRLLARLLEMPLVKVGAEDTLGLSRKQVSLLPL